MLSFSCLAQGASDLQRFGTGSREVPQAVLNALPQVQTTRGPTRGHAELSDYFPTPRLQFNGTCVAWAVSNARAYYARTREKRPVGDANIPSPAYIYNTAVEPLGDCEGGISIVDGLKVLKSGSYSYSDYLPLKDNCWARPGLQPSAAHDFRIDDGDAVKFSEWTDQGSRIRNLEAIKQWLDEDNPVIFDMKVGTTFMNPTNKRTEWNPGGYQIYYQPRLAPNDEKLGWHAMTIVGYADQFRAFKVINSWGTDWAQGGFGWISYDAIRNYGRLAFGIKLPGAVVPLPAPNPVPPTPVPQPTPKPDLISAAFSFVRCGKVDVIQAPGGREVRGFVGTQAEKDRVEALASEYAVKTVKVDLAPYPQCELLTTLASGLRLSDKPRIKLNAPQGATFTEDTQVEIEVVGPAIQSFVHLAYIESKGDVVNLRLPLGPNGAEQFAPQEIRKVRITIRKPFGNEMIAAIASPAPLFEKGRDKRETDRDFLTALRISLSALPTPSSRPRTFSADYFLLKTVEK